MVRRSLLYYDPCTSACFDLWLQVRQPGVTRIMLMEKFFVLQLFFVEHATSAGPLFLQNQQRWSYSFEAFRGLTFSVVLGTIRLLYPF